MATPFQSGTSYKSDFGCCTALKVGERIAVSGIAAGYAQRIEEQFKGAVERLDAALTSLGASLSDVVRTGVYYTRSVDREALRAAHGNSFRAIQPASSLTQVRFLHNDARVMIEAEAVVDSASTRKSFHFDNPEHKALGCAGLVQVGDELWLSGITAIAPDGSPIAAGNWSAQYSEVVSRIVSLLKEVNAGPADVVCTRTFTPIYYLSSSTPLTSPALTSLMHPGHPGQAAITVESVGNRETGVLIEVEAVQDAAARRNNVNTGRTAEEERHQSRSVRVGDVVYVSGSTSFVPGEIVRSPYDAYGQTLNTLETIRWSIEQQGLEWSDIVKTRTYVVGEENMDLAARALRETLSEIRPTATVVGVPALAYPRVLVEMEAIAVKGAGNAAHAG